MTQLGKINFGIAALYILFGAFQWIALSWQSLDAAGEGMAKAYILIILIYGSVLAALNLIRVQWVRVIVCALLILPVAFLLLNMLRNI